MSEELKNPADTEGKSFPGAHLNKVEYHSFQIMSKEEVIGKYVELKSAHDKIKKDNEFYRSALKKALEQNKLLKLKHPDIATAEYNRNWSWVNKIVFVLKKANRPLLSSEIIEVMTPHEPVLGNSYHKAQAFSAHLGKAVKYGRIVAYKLGGSRGYYYVLPDWVNDKGELIKEYGDKIFFK